MQLRQNSGKLPDDMLTIDEVASFLRVHPVTIRRWEKQNRLKSCRIGPKRSIRFKKKDITAFINRDSNIRNRVAPLHEEGFKKRDEVEADESTRQ
jgi:excisionase family DNA binding protein